MELIDFHWWRCVDGYRLQLSDANLRQLRRGTFLLEPDEAHSSGSIEALSDRFEVYRPEAFPALFRQFADTAPTNKGVLHFANRFGLIGGMRLMAYEAVGLDETLLRQRVLRRAIELFEASDLSGLADYFNQHVSRGRIRVELRALPTGKIAPTFVPQSLIEFLWLQFALHASSEAKLLRCEQCGTPFRVGVGTGRRDTAKFCSSVCKVAAFRARQRRSAARATDKHWSDLNKGEVV